MQRVSYATINRRKGTGLIPPNNKQWNVEHHALNLREELAVGLDVPLEHLAAFAVLPGTKILPHGALPLANEFVEHFRNDGAGNWSGMAVSIAPGVEWVIYNDAHPLTRVRATLMEELFHLRFKHPRSKVRLLSTDGEHRTINPTVEDEAYHTGAAALVPFVTLKRMVDDGLTAGEIGKHFRVSPDLVDFRAKVTRLYARLGKRSRTRR